MTQKASLNALLSVKPASYLTVYCAGSQEKLVHRLTVPTMLRCLDMLFQLCLSLKKEDYKFDRGEQPPWWPAVSSKKPSKQVKADMQKLLLTILQLGEDGEALAQEVAGVVHRQDYMQVNQTLLAMISVQAIFSAVSAKPSHVIEQSACLGFI